MPSTFLGLNTGLSGLTYYQNSLNTTAHNISNADVKGYSRQVVSSKAAEAVRVHSAYGMMGTGVQTTGISQLRNAYYDTKYRGATAKYSEYEAINEQLTQLQTYINEMQSESGYTKLLSNLSNTMQDLASHPSDATYRTQFIQAAGNFTDLINEIGTNYQNTQQDINDEIAIHVDTINSLSSQIFTLNQQIMSIEIRGGNANDLRDQREVLVDQLSELVTVNVTETPLLYGSGDNAIESGAYRYEVRIGNELLVDEMESRQLMVVARGEKINQNDLDGLYDVYWEGLQRSVGEKFDFNNTNLSGRIKGLFEVRDGNNANPFAGTIKEMKTGTENGSTALIHLDKGMDMDKLNLPLEGTITLNCKQYYYDGWEASYDEDGNLNDFVFQNLTVVGEDGKREPAEFNTTLDVGREGIMGESVDCRGIPYYMTQLNEFVRTFSKYMNDIFTAGADANGDKGMDFFTTPDVDGNDYVLTTEETPDSVKAGESSYYRLTALNWSVNQTILHDQNKLVVSYADDISQQKKDARGVVDKIIYGMKDQGMFAQGTPAQFLQSVTTSLGVDVSKYDSFSKNMNEVSTTINNQRLSVSSVDTNEEAASLVMYQNGYNLASKVISVMNQVYDKLINQTG